MCCANGVNILLVNDRANTIVIFGAVKNLEFLCSLLKIYMDSTFTYCTIFFYQLFLIHGIKNGNYVPLIFCLLPNKEKSTYKIAFEHIVRKCGELGLLFQPRKIVVDFE